MDSLNNLPRFYVGQKVVCIKSHSSGLIIKDKLYTVTAIDTRCKCARIVVNNILYQENNPNAIIAECNICKCYYDMPKYLAPSVQLFAPYQESIFPSLTYSKVVEKESELISQN